MRGVDNTVGMSKERVLSFSRGIVDEKTSRKMGVPHAQCGSKTNSDDTFLRRIVILCVDM